jgi:hypothetical protein
MNVPFGIWLLTAPWILGYENSSGTINDSAVGCLIIIIAVSGKWNQRHQYGGGWSSLFR